jgi:predicted  nucleic acid-binding Zn-ribbon protein
MNQTFQLYQLQKLDSDLDRIQTRVNTIDQMLASDVALRKAETKLQARHTEKETVRKELQALQELVDARNIKIEQSDSSLYGGKIQNPKELQDLQNEIAGHKRFIQQIEDQILEKMVALEQCEKDEQAALDSVKLVKVDMEKSHASLINEKAELSKEMGILQGKRSAVLPLLLDEFLSSYNQLRLKKGGVAVAVINEDSCSNCGSSLTASQIQIVRSGATIFTCPFCGRILYGG